MSLCLHRLPPLQPHPRTHPEPSLSHPEAYGLRGYAGRPDRQSLVFRMSWSSKIREDRRRRHHVDAGALLPYQFEHRPPRANGFEEAANVVRLLFLSMQIDRAFEGQFRDGFETTINRSGSPSSAV